MITQFEKSYPSCYGAPVIASVDTDIFTLRYFTKCMQCTFCNDACCTSGVDIDVVNVARIEAHADAIERFVGIPRARWFTEEFTNDPEFPGGVHTRTAVVGRGCVFLDQSAEGRGCMLHKFGIENGIDYHDLKPMVSALFPLTFDDGLLHPSDEARDGSLVCLRTGATLYRGVRDELLHYFGKGLVSELDAMET
jgi:hypothetical protein